MTVTMISAKRVMRDSIRECFPTGRTLISTLTAVSHGMSAEGLLQGADACRGAVSVLTLPQFCIRSFEGAESVNRVQWDGERSVHTLAHDESLTIAWSVEDSTLPQLTGTLRVHFDGVDHHVSGDMPPAFGSELEPPHLRPQVTAVSGPADAARTLRRLSDHGQRKMFELSTLLTPYAHDAIAGASRRVYREIHELDASATDRHIIDEIERESVLNSMMLGTQADSVVIRLIRRVAATPMTVRKSVALVIATAIWSSAETHVRSHIGDPHLGRVIRRLARDLRAMGTGSVSPDDVLEAYRAEHPAQRIGIGRIVDALTAGATVSSQTIGLDFGGDEGQLPQAAILGGAA